MVEIEMDIAQATADAFSPIHIVGVADVPPDTEVQRLELRYPETWFAPREHAPCADELEEQAISWMSELGLLTRPGQIETVRAMGPRDYGGCTTSMLEEEGVHLYSQYLTMWLLWDDEVVEASTDMAALEADFAAMAGLGEAGLDAPYHRAWRQIGDGVERMGGSAALRERWVRLMRDYADYAIAEVNVRNSPSVDNRSFDDALLMRATTIGMKPAMIYLEACSRIELDEAITSTDEYRQWAWHAAVLQGLQNDLASVPKDFLKGESDTNVVLRYRRDSGCSLLAACRAIIAIHDDSVEAFDRLAQGLLAKAEGAARDRVRTYLDYVRYMETGFGFYHTRVDRYARRAAVENGYALRLAMTRR
jgi:hypothetical protein